MNIDGTVAAYRLPYLLAGDSLVLKQDSGYYEHFYADLKPDVHYVGIARDLSNLIDKLEWAMKNDQEVCLYMFFIFKLLISRDVFYFRF